MIAYNTDISGFSYSLRNQKVAVEDEDFLLLGAGGSARAVAIALAFDGAKSITIANRSPEKAQQISELVCLAGCKTSIDVVSIDELEPSDKWSCIVNATSIGMSPNEAASPIGKDFLTIK